MDKDNWIKEYECGLSKECPFCGAEERGHSCRNCYNKITKEECWKTKSSFCKKCDEHIKYELPKIMELQKDKGIKCLCAEANCTKCLLGNCEDDECYFHPKNKKEILKQKKKILMVESDPFLLDMYKVKSEEAGFDFTGLECGEDDFLDKVVILKPDLICLGIILYKSSGRNTGSTMNGFDLIKLLKEDYRTSQIPVIFLTNMGQKKDVEMGKKLGAVDYLIMAETTPADLINVFIKIIN